MKHSGRKARLAELNKLRELATRELEALRHHEEEIAQLERDRDTVLEYYAGASEEALESLTPEQRHNLYKSFHIEVLAHSDGTTEIVLGNLLSYEDVYRGNDFEIASMYNFTNRMSLACGMIPNEEYHALAR